MSKETTTYILIVALVLSLISLAAASRRFHLPGNQQDYMPAQPISFSHRLHSGEMRINCLYCHHGADKSRHAGIPAASTCMNCHNFVTIAFGAVQQEDGAAKEEKRSPRLVVSPDVAKLYKALGLDEKRKRDPERPLSVIEWIKVHNLPDFVYFDHRPHVNAGVTCQRCHGNIDTMEQVRQVESLSMGWCVNCHRDVNENGVAGKRVHAPVDCTTCHY